MMGSCIRTLCFAIFALVSLASPASPESEVYVAATGRLVVDGYQPDGDSIRFIADQPESLTSIRRGDLLKPSNRDHSVQLRLEGIDAPETHFHRFDQPYGVHARDVFLTRLGFTVVDFGKKGKTVQSSQPASVPATILTRAADPYGRPIAYVIPGRMPGRLSSELDSALLDRTINYSMVADGEAYPMLYSSNPYPNRLRLREAARLARSQRKGVWNQDRTAGFALVDQESIGVGGVLIFPKLFRRCSDMLRTGETDLKKWLGQNRGEDDEVFLDSHRQGESDPDSIRLSSLISQSGNKVGIEADLTDLVFVER